MNDNVIKMKAVLNETIYSILKILYFLEIFT